MNYLAELLERYGGRVAPALAAYNAGPHRLSFWSTFPEYQDEELFAERIPFAETRNYVKIVQQNASLYARLYTDEGTLSPLGGRPASDGEDRKSTRLNSSHVAISYAVFCLKKKKRILAAH